MQCRGRECTAEGMKIKCIGGNAWREMHREKRSKICRGIAKGIQIKIQICTKKHVNASREI